MTVNFFLLQDLYCIFMFITLSIRTRVAGELLSYVSVPQLSLSHKTKVKESEIYCKRHLKILLKVRDSRQMNKSDKIA